MLIRHGASIEEYEISSEICERIDASCLLQKDIEWLQKQNPIRSIKYYDYIDESRYPSGYNNENLKVYFPPTINFGLIDSRLIDLALSFFDNPDSSISLAFRRLEGIVRERIGSIESGLKLLQIAFEGKKSKLHWGDNNGGEHEGKVGLFKSVFLTYRNPRAHREIESDDRAALREFMLINELYLLESSAFERVGK